jgi:hypothetical protein
VTRIITDADELDALLSPVTDTLPPKGTYHAAVQFDDAGEVVCYQLVQMPLIAEGLRSVKSGANLFELAEATIQHARSLGATQLLTMTAQNAQGMVIARFTRRMGFEQMPVNIHRRYL